MNIIKILVIGDNNTGKTSLLNKITTKKFNFKYQIPTIGIQFHKLIHKIKNQHFQLEFWDFSGSREYLPLIENYFIECNVVLICFDVSEQNTFTSIKNYWISIVSNYPNFLQKKILIIGNKNDLQKEVTVKQLAIHSFKNIVNTIFYYSAKNDSNFNKLIQLIIDIFCKQNNIVFEKSKKINTVNNYIEFFKQLLKKKSN